MSKTVVSRQLDGTIADVDSSVVETVQRLGKISRYEPPKVVSFPIDGMRVTGPLSHAGNH
jgi:hypothetical protein